MDGKFSIYQNNLVIIQNHFIQNLGHFMQNQGKKFILQNFCKPNKPITNINELIRGALHVP